MTEEVFRDILDVNLIGTFELTKLALPHLRATGDGAVVNITSVAGVRPTGSSVPYAVSKAALNHLTALLANVTGPDGAGQRRGTGTGPHAVDGGLGPAARPHGRTGARWAARVNPTTSPAAVVDVAANRYLTGQVVVVDGGLSLRS